MAKRWLALLIASTACQGPQQEAVQAPSGASAAGEAEAGNWWCYSADGFLSHCERKRFDCERSRERSRRPADPCAPERVAYCFRFVSKGAALSDTVVLECSAAHADCEDQRVRVTESQFGGRMLGECEAVE